MFYNYSQLKDLLQHVSVVLAVALVSNSSLYLSNSLVTSENTST